MKKENKISRELSLISEKDCEKEFEKNSFIHSVSKTISVIAMHDGYLTLSEYKIIKAIADQIASISDNQYFIKSMIYKDITHKYDFDTVLNELKMTSKNIDKELKYSLFEILTNLIQLQSAEENIFISEKLSSALGLNLETSSKQRLNIANSVKIFTKTISSVSNVFSSKTDIDKIEDIAKRYNQQKLLSLIQAYKNNSNDKKNILDQYNLLYKNIREELDSFQEQYNFYYDKKSIKMLKKVTELFIEQTKTRLQSVANRVELEKEMFKADMEDFISYSSNILSLELRKKFDTVEFEKDKFNDFFKNEAEKIIQEIYDKKIKNRNSKLVGLWKDELTLFNHELVNVHYIFKDIANDIKVQEISLSSKNNILKSMDDISNSIVNVTGKGLALGGVAGGTMALTTGLSSVATLASSAIAAINPVGMTLLGGTGIVIGASFIYKKLFQENKLKAMSIMEATVEIQNRLFEVCEEETKKFNDFLDTEVLDTFYKTAEKRFEPILRDVYFILYEDKKHNELIKFLVHNTLKGLKV